MAKAMIEPFDSGDFDEWQEKLDFFFCANKIGVLAANGSTAEKTRCEKRVSAYLISLLSKTVYSTLKTLCLPKAPSDSKYQEIGGKLTDHYKVQTSRSSVMHAFRNCTQLPTESVTDFSHRLQCSAGDCKCESHFDTALSD